MPSDRDIIINITAKASNLTSEINRAQQSLQQLSSGVQTSNATLKTHTQASTQAASALGTIRPNVQTSTGALGAFKQATQSSSAALQMHGQVAQATGASLGTVRAGAQTSGGALGQLGTSTKTVSTGMQTAGAAAQTASQAIKGMGSASTALTSSLSAAKDKIVAYAASYLAVQAAINGVKAIMSAGFGQDRLELAFTAITGSVADGRKELEFLRTTANRLGQDFVTLATGYKGLAAASQGTTLEGQKTKDAFLAIVEAGRALGLSSEQVGGALKAVEQAMSKGTLASEELRGQLSERIPGAFNITGRALGVTTAQLGKMLEAGSVLTDEWLPKFARQLLKEFVDPLKAAGGGALTAEQQFIKMGTAIKTILADIGQSDFVGRIANSVGRLADEVNRLRAARDALIKTGTEKAAETEKEITGGVPLSPAGKQTITQVTTLDAQIATLKTSLAELEKTIAGMGANIPAALTQAAERMRASLIALNARRTTLVEDIKTQLPTLRQPPDLLEGDSERIAQSVGGKRDELAVQTTRALAERDRIIKEAEALRTTKTVEGLAPEEVAKAVADFYKEEIKKFEKATAELRAKEVTMAPTPTAVPTPAVTARPATILTPPPMTTPGTPLRAPENQRLIMERAAQRYNLDPLLIEAVAWRESRFDPRAVSPAGARGVMQLMPSTAQGLGVKDSFDIEQNIMGGAKYLAQLIEKFPGDMERVLAAYNAGPYAKGLTSGDLTKLLPETKKYVPAVLAQHQALQAVTGQLPLPMRSPELANATPLPATTATGALADLAARQKEQRKLTDEIIGTTKAEEEHAKAVADQSEEIEELLKRFRETEAALKVGETGMDAYSRKLALQRLEAMNASTAILELARASDTRSKALEAEIDEMANWSAKAQEMGKAPDLSETLMDIVRQTERRDEAGNLLPPIPAITDNARLSGGDSPDSSSDLLKTDPTETQRLQELEQDANRVINVMGSLSEAILHGGDAWISFTQTALQELAKLLTESEGFRTAMTEIFTSIAQGIANMLKPSAAGGPSTIESILGIVAKVAPAAAGAAGGGGGGDFNYHGQSGGVFAPGQRWNVGEAGRELMVTSKQIRLVGLSGPEVIRPDSAGMVIPHQETMTILRKNALHLAPTMLAHAARQDKLSPLRTAAQVGIPLPSVLRQSLPSAGTGTYDNVVANMARREAGGPVAAGNQYLTGEGGVELLMGAQAGRGGSGGKGPNIINVNMHLHDVREANTFVKSRSQVARALRGALDDGSRGMGG